MPKSKHSHHMKEEKKIKAYHTGFKEYVTVLYFDKKYDAWYVKLKNGGLMYTNLLSKFKK